MNMLKAALMVLAAGASGAWAQELDAARSASNELFTDALDRTSMAAAPTYAPKVGGLIVSRYNLNLNDNGNGRDDVTTGGQLAYTKLTVAGNVYEDALTYNIQFKFGEANGLAVLDDAYGTYKLEDQWSFRWGQFKPPVLREENISDKYQLAANRSVMNSVFTQSRTQGVMVSYAGQDFRAMASFNDGIRTPNIDYVGAAEADGAATGRFEYRWDGDWKQYDEFTSWSTSKYFGAVGAAAHYQEGGATVAAGVTPPITTNTNILLTTVDVMAKGPGWNAYAAAVYRNTNPVGAISVDDWGLLVQGGWFVGPKWELFARCDVVLPDQDRNAHTSFTTLTFGANKYISPDSHAVKLTLDVEWFLNRQSAGIAGASTLTGLLAGSDQNQLAFQAQLQIAF